MSRSAANFWQWPHPPPPPASGANGANPARGSTPSTIQPGRAPTAAAFPTAATAAAAAAAAVAAAVGAGINSVMPANSAGPHSTPWWGAPSHTADDSSMPSTQAHITESAGAPSRPGPVAVPTQLQSQQASRGASAGGSGAGPVAGAVPRREAEEEEEEEWEVVRRPVDGPGGSGQPPERMQVMRWQPPGNPALWSAVGRVASVAWSALKLCHRYVLVPAASWALNNLKAYVEEQLAIHRALAARPVPPTVIQYGDAEIRVCTDNMSSARRALDTPYGLVSYMTTLRGRGVVVVPVTLRWRADVDVFWSEVDAGHALATQLHQQSLVAHSASPPRPGAGAGPSNPSRTSGASSSTTNNSSPRSAPVARYLGCCRSPGLTCHVYEHPLPSATATSPATSLPASGPPSTPSTSTPAPGPVAAPAGGSWSWYSLREALGPPGSPAARAGLCGWEARLAVCGELVEAAVLMLRSGVGVRRLTSSNVLLLLPAPGTDGGGSMHTGAPGTAPSLPVCRLAPGCGFRLLTSATAAPAAGAAAAAPSSQQRGTTSPAQGGAAGAGGAEGRAGGSGGGGGGGSVGSSGGGGGGGGGGGDLEVTVAGLARGLGMTLFQVLLGPDAAARTPPGQLLEALAAAQPAALLDRAVVPPLTDEQAWPLLAAAYPLLAWGQQRADKDRKALGGAGGGLGGGAGSGGSGWQRQGLGSSGQATSVRDEAVELVGYLLREVTPAVRELAAAVAAATAAHRRHSATDDPFHGASAPPLAPPGAGLHDPWVGGGGGQAGPSAPGTGLDAPSAPPAPADACPHAHPHPGQGAYPTVPSGYPVTASAGLGVAAGRSCGAAAVPAAAAPPPQPPTEFLCPITQDLMSDPVVCADGHSYERSAIAAWLAGGHATSPLTGARLPSAALTPNYALRSIIRDWRERHGA